LALDIETSSKPCHWIPRRRHDAESLAFATNSKQASNLTASEGTSNFSLKLPLTEHKMNAKSLPEPDSVAQIFTTCNTELQRGKGGANDALNYRQEREHA